MGSCLMNKQTIIDLLAAGRVANLPSVVSNVVTGAVIFGLAWTLSGDQFVSWKSVTLGLSLIHI